MDESAKETLVRLTKELFQGYGPEEKARLWEQASDSQCEEALRILVSQESIPWFLWNRLGTNMGKFEVNGVAYEKSMIVDRLYALITNKVFLNVSWAKCVYEYRHHVSEVGSSGGMTVPSDNQLLVYQGDKIILKVTLSLSKYEGGEIDNLARQIADRGGARYVFARCSSGGFEGTFTQVTAKEVVELANFAGLPSPDRDKIINELG